MTRAHGKRFMGIPDEFWIGFVIMVGFFLKLIYCIRIGYTGGTLNLGSWLDLTGGNIRGGHIEVIHYFFTFHRLPDFSPAGLTGYANPPLYYLVSSLIMEILHRLLNWSAGVSLSCVQAMGVIYVMIGECCVIGILQKLGVRGRKLVVGIVFVMFFPTFYHLAAAMDGSGMCFMFSAFAMNSALSWYRSRRVRVLTSAAVNLGLGLLTSYAAAAVIPGMLVLFVSAVNDGRRNQKPLREQFRRFGIITAIMGLFWPLYISVRFRLPLFYAEGVGAKILPPDTSPAVRLAWPKSGMFSSLHTGLTDVFPNIPAQTIKTAVIDFQAFRLTEKGGTQLVTFLLCLCIVLCIAAHMMLLYVLFANGRLERADRRFLFIGYLSVLVGYVLVCFARPYTGTMNFKNIAFVLIYPLAGICACGNGDTSDNRFERVMTFAANGMVLIMALLTAFLFGYY